MIQWSWTWWSLYRKQPFFGAISMISCKSSFGDTGLNNAKLVLLYAPDVCACLFVLWQFYCLFNSSFSSQQRKHPSSALLALCGGMHRWLIYKGKRHIPWKREVQHFTISIPSYPRLLRMGNYLQHSLYTSYVYITNSIYQSAPGWIRDCELHSEL